MTTGRALAIHQSNQKNSHDLKQNRAKEPNQFGILYSRTENNIGQTLNKGRILDQLIRRRNPGAECDQENAVT